MFFFSSNVLKKGITLESEKGLKVETKSENES